MGGIPVSLPPQPARTERLHFIGIAGKAMGAIAAALARSGWIITGSDADCYPPMDDYLRRCGISVCTPFAAANIPPDVDLVVVGKRIRENNPELQNVIARKLRLCSYPELLRTKFLTNSRNAVVSGGVGKTTTAAMLAWILDYNGHRPDYLLGGLAHNFTHPARFIGAAFTILEGDEYASSFADLRPKFLHYRPEVAVVTNVLEDHPDLYPNWDAVQEVFIQLARELPATGLLVLSDRDDATPELRAAANCQVVVTGFSNRAEALIAETRLLSHKSSFRLREIEFDLPCCGRMNISNAAMASIAAAHFGISYQKSAAALNWFRGLQHRQSCCQVGDYVLVQDKATHPRALSGLFQALRQRFPGRRLVSVIQPRATGGRRWIYQIQLPDVLAQADQVILTAPYEHNPGWQRNWEGGPFSVEQLHSELAARAVPTFLLPIGTNLSAAVRAHAQTGDVIVLTVPEQAGSLAGEIATALRR